MILWKNLNTHLRIRLCIWWLFTDPSISELGELPTTRTSTYSSISSLNPTNSVLLSSPRPTKLLLRAFLYPFPFIQLSLRSRVGLINDLLISSLSFCILFKFYPLNKSFFISSFLSKWSSNRSVGIIYGAPFGSDPDYFLILVIFLVFFPKVGENTSPSSNPTISTGLGLSVSTLKTFLSRSPI